MIITSNAEKELPDAFLRRCVFHYIEFPDEALMERIVRVHHPDLDERLLEQALEVFYRLRDVQRSAEEALDQRAHRLGTGARHRGVDPARITARMPFLGVLLKKDKDVHVADGALASCRRPPGTAGLRGRGPRGRESPCSPSAASSSA